MRNFAGGEIRPECNNTPAIAIAAVLIAGGGLIAARDMLRKR